MKYNEEKIKECVKWVEENGLDIKGGSTIKAFCKAMGIGESTYHEWKVKSEFAEAIKEANKKYIANIEQVCVTSLMKLCKGFSYEKPKLRKGLRGGKMVVIEDSMEVVNVPPNMEAIKFVLTNLNSGWQNVSTSKVDANVNAKVDAEETYTLADVPEELLTELADKIQDAEQKRRRTITNLPKNGKIEAKNNN